MKIKSRLSKQGSGKKAISFATIFSSIVIVMMIQLYFLFNHDPMAAHSAAAVANPDDNSKIPKKISSDSKIPSPWCSQVASARSGLVKNLHISYPCENLQPATSAVVCMLTDGAADESKATRVVFTAKNYIDGAMALGQSVKEYTDPSTTHMLLLVRDGFVLSEDDTIRLQSVGWTIGVAPNFDLERKYVPGFPRYKTTYTKVTAIGMEEYKCVLLMDADTLVVGDIRDLLSCKIFTQPQHRVAGTLDYSRYEWMSFNTGSILWRTDNKEMERVYQLSKDDKFMQRFSSDQAFLNQVYPDRKDRSLNKQIITGKNPTAADSGSVVTLSWDYNAQTHVEAQLPVFWEEHRETVKILHFTEKKGWQCRESYEEPDIPMEKMPKPCPKENPVCFCRNGHLYWKSLRKAKELASTALLEARKT